MSATFDDPRPTAKPGATSRWREVGAPAPPGRSGMLMTAMSAVFFGSLAIFGKAAASRGIPLSELLAIRFGAASGMLWLLALLRREQLWHGRRSVALLLMGGLYIAQAGAFFTSLRTVPAAVTSILLYLYPVVVMAAAVMFLGESMSRTRMVAAALALVGVFLVVDPLGARGHVDAPGVLFGLLTAAIYATYILAGRVLLRGVPPVVATAYIASVAGAVAGLAGGLSGSLRPLQPDGYLIAILMAALATAIPATLFLAGLARVGATRAAIISTLEPATTVILAGLVLGERLGVIQILGGAVVIAAAALIARATPGELAVPPVRE